MPYDASPYTKEELEALRHPPTRCVNLSDDERWLATLDAVTSERDEAVALLKEARCDVEGFATWTDDPDSSYYSSLDECRAPAVARLAKIDAFLAGRGQRNEQSPPSGAARDSSGRGA